MIQDIFPHRMDITYKPDRKASGSDRIVYFTDGGVLFGTSLPTVSELGLLGTDLTYLFSIDDISFFLPEDVSASIPEGYRFRRIRELRYSLEATKEELFVVYTARQLWSWYCNNRFCGRCGERTGRSLKERAITCDHCGNIIYPRVVPAVIVGVIDRDNDKILVTKYNGRGFGYYALVAGFAEIGETLEQTVEREVMEETGLKVKNIRYYKSQPWGIADDLLTGFFCEVDGSTEIHMDESELSVAEWKSREEVQLQPDELSLTNEMMTVFKNGKVPNQ